MIVAVFGGSKDVPRDVLDLAQCAGKRISARGFVILTGGMKETQLCPKTVKDAALTGVAIDGHWIGVLKDGNDPDFKRHDEGGVVYSHMNHQRNFLEASLCDAAIVLKGAKGTISEGVSTLCLGKPVLLAGTNWTKECFPLYQLFKAHVLTENRKSDLVKTVLDRLGTGNESGPMRHLIAATVRPDNVLLSEHSRLVPAAGLEACEAIARWLVELETLPRTGEFPELKGYEQVKEKYDEWLKRL
ncbi:hypothetical protein [Nonomuraea monospora]